MAPHLDAPQSAAETWAASTPPQQNAYPTGGYSGQRAGFWARFGAHVIDGLVVGVPVAIVFFVLLATLPRGEPELCTVDGRAAICEYPSGTSILILVFYGLAVLAALIWFWHGTLVGEKGQTPGKKALGLRVVDIATGQPVGRGRGIGRGLMKWFVSGSIVYLGFLWSIWDSEKQTWHDKVASSVVIKE